VNRPLVLFAILGVLGSTACSTAPPSALSAPPPRSRTLTVFAAASLSEAFTEIGKAVESANPGLTVRFSFGGSQALRTQIEAAAPADVFASANAREMNALVADGLVDKAAPQVFLSNQLVVILAPHNPAGLTGLMDLAKPRLKLVLAAADVPVGAYARQSLDEMEAAFGSGFKAKVLANVVSNEDDVKQVVAKVQLGEADAGIVYVSDAIAAPSIQTIQIPVALNLVAKYPIAALARSPNADLASRFVAFVLSPDGQAILKRWGFGPPK
jgi:molybdate transport system substrate-binding protein